MLSENLKLQGFTRQPTNQHNRAKDQTRTQASKMPTTRSGRQYGVMEAVEPSREPVVASRKPPSYAETIINEAVFEHKFVEMNVCARQVPMRDDVILAMTASDLKPNPKTNYLLGTHHFIFTLKPDDAVVLGFDKLELVFRTYYGCSKGLATSFAVKHFIVHRGADHALVIGDADSGFWRDSAEDFKFVVHTADSVGEKVIAPNSVVLQVFLEALKGAQKDMQRIITKVMRRKKFGVFKLDDVLLANKF